MSLLVDAATALFLLPGALRVLNWCATCFMILHDVRIRPLVDLGHQQLHARVMWLTLRRASAHESASFISKPQADTSDAPFRHLAAIGSDEFQDSQQQQHHPCEQQIRQLVHHTNVSALSRQVQPHDDP